MTLDLQSEVETLFREKVMEFVSWCGPHWKITEKDRSDKDWAFDKSQDYVDGYNAAIDGLKDAFECWNEEFGP